MVNERVCASSTAQNNFVGLLTVIFAFDGLCT